MVMDSVVFSPYPILYTPTSDYEAQTRLRLSFTCAHLNSVLA